MCFSPPPPKSAVPESSSHAVGQAGAQAPGNCPLLTRMHTRRFSKSLRCYSPAHLFFSSWYKTTFMWLPINGDQQGDTAMLQPKHTSEECQGAGGGGWAHLLILCPPAPEAPRAACCCLCGPVRHNRWLLGTGKRSVHRMEGLGLKGIVSRVENLTSFLRDEDTGEAFQRVGVVICASKAFYYWLMRSPVLHRSISSQRVGVGGLSLGSLLDSKIPKQDQH